jgi:hypothetical protein
MICDIMLGQWSVPVVPIEEVSFFSRMEYFCYMGIKYFNLGQFEEAIDQFSIAVKEKTLIDLEENAQIVEDEAESEDLEVPIEA